MSKWVTDTEIRLLRHSRRTVPYEETLEILHRGSDLESCRNVERLWKQLIQFFNFIFSEILIDRRRW